MEEELRKRLYGSILVRLASHFGIDEGELAPLLKPEFLKLRSAYRQGRVTVAYESDARVGAYLLAYYPNYVMAAFSGLRQLARDLSQGANVLTFCGGPSPEIVSLAAAIHEVGGFADLNVFNVDLHAGDWAWAVSLSQSLASKFAPSVNVEVTSVQLDIGNEPLSRLELQMRDAALFVFQNCLNEVWSLPRTLPNITQLAETCKTGSYFAFIDHNNYAISREAFSRLRELFLSRDFDIVEDCGQPWPMRLSLFIPEHLTNTFFDPIARDVNGNWQGEAVTRNLNLRSLIVKKT